MAQNAFAIFFLLVAIGCALSLLDAILTSWSRIRTALRAELPQPRPLVYKSEQRRPIDIPYVARRLPPGAVPCPFSFDAPRYRSFSVSRAAARQLRFGF